MLKTKAIELLGGSAAAAAEAIGVTRQAVEKWPAVLPDRIADRVIATMVRMRRKVPAEVLSKTVA